MESAKIAPPPACNRGRNVLAAVALLMVTLLAYQPAMRAGFIWDDDDYVTNNHTLRTAEGLKQIWFEPRSIPQYYPLVHSSFWMEYQLWGLNPTGYHVINIVLHVIAALMLWRVLALLGLPGAWAVACIFAVHPVHVESVAWITERKNVLSLIFYLGALFAYFQSDRQRNYVIALMLFVCAMLSKTVACSLPAAIVLIVWWKHGRVTRKDVLRLAPMFVIGLALGVMTAWLEKRFVGADGQDWSLSFIERILVAGRAVWFYAMKMVWPAGLTFIYPRWQIDSSAAWQYLFPAGVIAVLATLWFMRGKWGRGPLVAALLFCGTLLPALGFVNLYPMRYSFVADHFQYAGSIALIVSIVAASSRWLDARRLNIAACLVVLTLGALTWKQSLNYHDRVALWQDTISKNQNCWMAELNLAVCLYEQGDDASALPHVRRSLQIKPDHAEAHNTLGVIYARRGKAELATREYEEALRLGPYLASAHANYGVLLARTGKPRLAIPHFAAAAELSPSNVNTIYNWATASADVGALDEAEFLYRRTLEMAPSHAGAHLHYSDLLRQRGRMDEAERECRRAVKFAPTDARSHNALAILLIGKRSVGAVDSARRACELTKWTNAEMIGNLAVALSMTGQTREAIAAADRAVASANVAGNTKLAEEIAAWKRSLTSAEAGADPRDAAPQ
jgi:Flp pilus assembly protein TadD